MVCGFLDRVKIPKLTISQREDINGEISVGEVLAAIKNMPVKKCPGPDGLPAEYYKAYADIIAPRLLEMLQEAKAQGLLPVTMRKALIVMIPKKENEETEPGACRSLSLLGVDTKILATRLRTVVTHLVMEDQCGFMPGHGTHMTLRRLSNIMCAVQDQEMDAALAALDIEKAFDMLGWDYLWEALERMGLGDEFLRWLCLLYVQPVARVTTGNIVSKVIRIKRGTKQGCPLSPLLFALAMEPLALYLR